MQLSSLPILSEALSTLTKDLRTSLNQSLGESDSTFLWGKKKSTGKVNIAIIGI